jgi:transcriptional regulator with XRE-family HTH domain
MDKNGMTTDEVIALFSQDPEFAALWAESLPKIDLGINIIRLREERGWTQQQLAEATGLKQPRVANIERSVSNPTLLTITRIANALGVRVERLFADTSVRRHEEPGPEPRAEAVVEDERPVPRPVRKRKPRTRAALVS